MTHLEGSNLVPPELPKPRENESVEEYRDRLSDTLAPWIDATTRRLAALEERVQGIVENNGIWDGS